MSCRREEHLAHVVRVSSEFGASPAFVSVVVGRASLVKEARYPELFRREDPAGNGSAPASAVQGRAYYQSKLVELGIPFE